MKKRAIYLTEEQVETLERLLDFEWEQELCYQWNNSEKDITYLEELLSLKIAIMGKAKSGIDAFVHNDIIDNLLKEIKDLESENN